jgi:hypothetical protein
MMVRIYPVDSHAVFVSLSESMLQEVKIEKIRDMDVSITPKSSLSGKLHSSIPFRNRRFHFPTSPAARTPSQKEMSIVAAHEPADIKRSNNHLLTAPRSVSTHWLKPNMPLITVLLFILAFVFYLIYSAFRYGHRTRDMPSGKFQSKLLDPIDN